MAETTTKNKKRKSWIVACIGLIFIILGSLSVFKTEFMNNMAISMGSKAITTEMVELYPEHKDVWASLVDVMEAAIEARTTSPETLAKLLEKEISNVTGNKNTEIGNFVKELVSQINSAYKTSETEEIYIGKLKALVAGIKSSL